jgi:hypothetical protein
MSVQSRIVRYVGVGILADLAIVLSALLYVVVRGALSFNGTCFAPFSLDTFSRPCTLREAVLLEPVFLFVLASVLWPITTVVLIIPPALAGLVGFFRSGKEPSGTPEK